MTEANADRQATVGEVFAIPEFRALWFARCLSLIGDQLARVALAILAFDQTGSPALTALTYALTYLPAVVSGPLLSGLADRYPRRAVMIAADLARGILVLGLALPHLPLAVVATLIVAVILLDAPFNAARLATLPLILEGDRYPVGLGFTQMAQQAVQLLGFGVGGVIVAALGTHVAFIVDAGTFALSALLIRVFIMPRPAALTTADASQSLRRSASATIRSLWDNAPLRYLILLSWVYGFFVVPEGLAAPYVAHIGEGTSAVGFFMAAAPTANVAGTFLITRFIPPGRRSRYIAPLAVLCGVPLIAFAASPNLLISILLLGIHGLLTGYLAVVMPAVVRLIPEARRGQGIGVVSSGMLTAQGLGLLLSGLVADMIGSGGSIAVFAGAGTAVALGASIGWARAVARVERGQAASGETADPDQGLADAR